MLKFIKQSVVAKRAVSVAVLGLIIYGILVVLDANKPVPEERKTKPKRTQVFVQKVAVGEQVMQVIAQGVATPKSSVQLKARVEGQIVAVHPNFVNGGQVRQGDVLVQLETEDYELSVIQAKAKVAQAAEKFTKSSAQAHSAQRELMELGRHDASELARGIPQLNYAKAELESAKAALAQAELALSRTQIIAPFNGIIESESVSVGQLVNRNSSLGKMFANDLMEVALSLSLANMQLLGMPLNYGSSYAQSRYPVELYSQMGPQQATWQGKIVRSSGLIDSQTRTVQIVVEVPDPYGLQNPGSDQPPLLAGLFVNAQIAGRSVPDLAVIPRKALRNKNKIWLVDDDNRLTVTDVTIVSKDQGRAWVSGLTAGSRVITSSLPIATVGMSLRPTNEKSVSPIDSQLANEQGQIVPKKRQQKSKDDGGVGTAKLERSLRKGKLAGDI
ncbi:efflux RND transporter periplasmic adaptor subunit [Neiella marina]|uniref:efflux RND transporter periplasmic adaptor subunit n=1 Tax=Neiella marina TaxID=508461 RepID=UPI0013028E34|nr:efflux RND transporter periplasmic adaptor subunit [Neiella marina]